MGNRPQSQSESQAPLRLSVSGWSLVKLICAVPLGLVVLSWLARWLLLADLLCNFRVQLTAAVALSALLFAVGRRWVWMGVMMAAALPGMVEIGSLYLPARQPPAGSSTIRILSLNLLYLNDQYESVFELVDRVRPDAINLVEYDYHWRQGLQSLSLQYPYQVTDPRYSGLGNIIFSKHPLRDLAIEPHLPRSPLAVAAMNWEGHEICLVSVHTLSPTTLRRLQARNLQLSRIADVVRRYQLPTVVMGDFNATAWSPYVKDFVRNSQLRDSRAGFGLQPTWPSWTWAWPARIAIDHFFVSPEIRVHDRWVETSVGSDHLPIVIEISLGTAQPLETVPQSKREARSTLDGSIKRPVAGPPGGGSVRPAGRMPG